jgi:hypothetical protein
MSKKRVLVENEEVTLKDEKLRKHAEKILGPGPWIFEGALSSKGGLRQYGTQKTMRIPIDQIVPIKKK